MFSEPLHKPLSSSLLNSIYHPGPHILKYIFRENHHIILSNHSKFNLLLDLPSNTFHPPPKLHQLLAKWTLILDLFVAITPAWDLGQNKACYLLFQQHHISPSSPIPRVMPSIGGKTRNNLSIRMNATSPPLKVEQFTSNFTSSFLIPVGMYVRFSTQPTITNYITHNHLKLASQFILSFQQRLSIILRQSSLPIPPISTWLLHT